LDYEDKVWVLDVQRGQWNAGAREKLIQNIAARDGKRVRIGIEQEPGSGGKESADNTVRSLRGYSVWKDKVTGDKEVRAEPYASAVANEDVWLPTNAVWLDRYVEEIRHFPQGKYKDQVDASSGAFKMLTTVRVKVGAL
jgi:predicted phage terminase large subunit-like protein